MQLMPAKALQCQRQPTTYPKAIHQRLAKLDALRGDIRRSDKNPIEVARLVQEIADEQEYLKGLL